ncbi:MAG: hypothetical protein ACR2QE_11305 [Acidimicrobiales bacterium]
MRLTRVVLPLLLLLALVASACGSSSVQDVSADDGRQTNDDSTAAEDPETSDDTDSEPQTDPDETPPSEADEDPEADTPDEETPEQDEDADGGLDSDAARLELAAASTRDESYRGEMFMSMSMGVEGFSFDMGSDSDPLATMAFDGTESSMQMDLGVLFGDLTDALASSFGAEADLGDLGFDPADMRMDMVASDDAMYIHAPFFDMAGAGDVGAPVEDWMTQAADGWISISLDEVTSADAFGDFADLAGLSSTAAADDFMALLDAIGEAELIGSDQSRGVDVERYRVSVSMDEIMALQGGDIDELVGPGLDDLFADLSYDFDVLVADDGRVHAIEIFMDEELFDGLGAGGDEIPNDLDYRMSMRLELFDHGDADIDVVVPFGAVDMTDAFLASLESLPG